MQYIDTGRLKIALPRDLDRSFSFIVNQKLDSTIFKYELTYWVTEARNCRLRIYHHPSFRLYELLTNLRENGFKPLRYLITPNNEDEKSLNFDDSQLLDLNDGDNLVTHGEVYVELFIDSILRFDRSSREGEKAEFYFSTTGDIVIEDLFSKAILVKGQRVGYELRKTNSAPIRFSEFYVDFLTRIRPIAERDYYEVKFSKQLVLCLSSEGRITDKYNIDQIINIGSFLRLFLSLYFTYNLEIAYTNLYDGKCTTEIVGKSHFPEVNLRETTKLFGVLFNDVEDALSELDASFILTHIDSINDMIKQFLFTRLLTGQARFIMLYNVMEQFRNFYNQNLGINTSYAEDYRFAVSKKKGIKFIKDKLKEVERVIHEDDKSTYLDHASMKVSFVYKKQMFDQLNEFFKKTKVSLRGVDLKDLIRVRNKIYHGSIDPVIFDQAFDYNDQIELVVRDLFIATLFKDKKENIM